MRAVWVVAVGLWLTSSGSARALQGASVPGEAARFDYQAPDDCPATDGFVENVRQRVESLVFAEPGQPSRRFSVLIEASAREYEGTLEITEREGGSSTRTLHSGNCIELVEALALIVALAIDPRASTTPQPDVSPPSPSPSSHPAPRPSRRPATLPAPPSLLGALGASSAVLHGLAPSTLFAAGIFGELGAAASGVWAPRARLTLVRSTRHRLLEQQGGAAFSWVGAMSEFCAIGLRLGGVGSEWRPCFAVEAGFTDARGFDTQNPRNQMRRWLALGLASEAVVTLGSQFLIAGELGALAPVTRYDYVLGTSVIHRVPDLVGRAALRVGIVLR